MITVSDLVKLSGIEAEAQAIDYAIPCNSDGNYPHDGRAIAVYMPGRFIPDIVPYSKLAKMALERPTPELRMELEEIAANE